MATREEARIEQRREKRRKKPFTFKMWIIVVSALVLLTSILFILIISGSNDEPYPEVRDHWHSEYTVSICGEIQKPFAYSKGGIHTHGEGSIHIHPTNARESGSNATLARFIAGTGGRLTDSSITLPSGKTYNNGDHCDNNKPGEVFLRINNVLVTNISLYVPRDDDEVNIAFGNP